MKYLALLLAVATPSLAQTVQVQRGGFDSDSVVVTTSQLGTVAQAQIFNWVDRVPLDPSVVLTQVVSDTPLSLAATLTVRNTSSTTVSGSVSLSYSYFAAGGFGTWGGSDGSGGGVSVATGDLAPGEVRTLDPWTLTRAFLLTHGPMTLTGGFWSDVLNSCIGSGEIPYSVNARVQAVSVFGAGIELVSATLEANVSGELTLDVDLGLSADATNYCPSQVNSSGMNGTLTPFGVAAPSAPFAVLAEGLPSSTVAVLFINDSQAMVPMTNGTICIGGTRLFRSEILMTPAAPAGSVLFDTDLTGLTSGATVFGQAFFREPQGFTVTDALEIVLR